MTYKRELHIELAVEDFTYKRGFAGTAVTDPAYSAVGMKTDAPIIANQILWTSKAYRLSDYVVKPVGRIKVKTFSYKVMQRGWTLGVRDHKLRIYVDNTKILDKSISIPEWNKYIPFEERLWEELSPDASMKVGVDFYVIGDPLTGYEAYCGVMSIHGEYESEEAPGVGGVIVKVTNAETGAAIADATCYILKGAVIVASKRTDSTGTAVFTSITEGGYTLRVVKSGFYDVEYPVGVQPGQTIMVSVSMAPVPPPWYLDWLTKNWMLVVGGTAAIVGTYVIVKRLTGVSPIYIVTEKVRERLRKE